MGEGEVEEGVKLQKGCRKRKCKVGRRQCAGPLKTESSYAVWTSGPL